MNSIERVLNTIHGGPPTPVPRGEFVLDLAFIRHFLSWQNSLFQFEHLPDIELVKLFCQYFKHDIVCLQSGNPDATQPNHPALLSSINDIEKEELFIFWVVNGVFQSIMERRGLMKLLMEIADTPHDIGKELWHKTDKVIATMLQGIDAGVHGIMIADDIAYQRSTYTSPIFIEEYLLPAWKNQVDKAKELGVPVFFHSDGNLNAVLPIIVAAGFDGLQCIESSAGMDISSVKRKYGADLCLMGNIDPALLCKCSNQKKNENEIDGLCQAVKNVMNAASDGGVIFGTSSGLHSGMQPELVHRMYQLALEKDPNIF